MNRGDVGMIQRRKQLRLALEAGEPFGICRERFRKNFDRDVAAEPCIACAINLTHAAGADGRQDFIRPEASAGTK